MSVRPLLSERASGLFLHLTSLAGPHGHGDLGPAAHRFAEFLASAGQRWWQVLPIGPLGAGWSPYASPSSFAGNPGLISLDLLCADGLLDPSDLSSPKDLGSGRARYAAATRFRQARLRRAFGRFESSARPEQRRALEHFRDRHAAWLEDYALFCALKKAHRGAAWPDWESDFRERRAAALGHARRRWASEIRYQEFLQFTFDAQWSSLRDRCRQLGVVLLGDVPMFVAYDGADVWQHREIFHLDRHGRRTALAGVPPDPYSETGQLWGNPLYRWSALRRTDYAWWIARLELTLKRFDAARLDHFIGFRRYWEVPVGARDARRGRFVRVPGEDFFERARALLGGLPFVAEDLGLVTPEVTRLRDRFSLPGMRVLQFAFEGAGANDHQPHRYSANSVVYTGTHDNDTIMGWLAARRGKRKDRARQREQALRYVGSNGDQFNWDMIRLALMSVANVAIFPAQDLLGLGSSARMNVPGTARGNWEWRLGPGELRPEIAERMALLCETYERVSR
jgi:4-alpha-glucanotransferase